MSGQVQKRNDAMVELLRSEFPRSPWGCAFLAYNSTTDVDQTGNGAVATVDFDTEVYDVGNDFAADTFTAPSDGAYLLVATVFIDELAAAMTTGQLLLVTNNRSYYGTYGNYGAMRDAGNQLSTMVVAIADMSAGHAATVTLTISNGAGDDADIHGGANAFTYFCGHRVI